MEHEKGTMTLGRERVDVCLSCTTWQRLALWSAEHGGESQDVEPPAERVKPKLGFCW